MRKIYLFVLAVLGTVSTNAQWTATNVSPAFPNEIVYDIHAHNGLLYGATNFRGLTRLNGSTWDSVAFSGFSINQNSIHIEALGSAENYLYAVVQYQSCSQSEVYRSTDSGQTFTIDTVGLPRFNCPIGNQSLVLNINRLYSIDDHIIAIINGGNYIKEPGSSSWTAMNDTKVKLAEYFGAHNGTWYAYNTNSGYNLQVSTDSGATWTTPTNTNIPPLWDTKSMCVNPTSGRIFMGGRGLTQQIEKIIYSDDEGASWDSLTFNQYIGTNWLSVQQSVQDILAIGDTIIVQLDNNQTGTRPDILTSTNQGNSFAADTMGLPTDGFGTAASRGLLVFDGSIYLPMSFNEVYRKNVATSVRHHVRNKLVGVYPNPAQSNLLIKSNEQIGSLRMLDINGRVVQQINSLASNNIDISTLKKGMYFIQFRFKNGAQETIKVIKY